jgi:hypothetical protein
MYTEVAFPNTVIITGSHADSDNPMLLKVFRNLPKVSRKIVHVLAPRLLFCRGKKLIRIPCSERVSLVLGHVLNSINRLAF